LIFDDISIKFIKIYIVQEINLDTVDKMDIYI